MPASLKRLRSTGTTVLLHTCEECGADAPFGVGVSLGSAIGRLTDGDPAAAKRHLGRWYCMEHVGNHEKQRP